MEQKDLERILHGDIEHIDNVNEHDIALYEMNIKVHPKDVKKMLEAYLSKKITADQLVNWAGFLCIRAEYCSPDYYDLNNYYEDMWYVVQKLSTPEIDGEINEAQVKQYLVELEKYEGE
jgi:hypothetical protein